MALTDMIKDFYSSMQKAVRPIALGAALAYCGPTIDDDREGCRDDNDCRNGRVCEYDRSTGERYCVSGDGEGDDLYTTKDFCNFLLNECCYEQNDKSPEECQDDISNGGGLQGCINRSEQHFQGADTETTSRWIGCSVENHYCDREEREKYCGPL